MTFHGKPLNRFESGTLNLSINEKERQAAFLPALILKSYERHKDVT